MGTVKSLSVEGAILSENRCTTLKGGNIGVPNKGEDGRRGKPQVPKIDRMAGRESRQGNDGERMSGMRAWVWIMLGEMSRNSRLVGTSQ